MKIDKLWLVSDPYESAMPDESYDDLLLEMLWETDLQGFFYWCRGSNKNSIQDENIAVYDNEEEALLDAESRIQAFYQDNEVSLGGVR